MKKLVLFFILFFCSFAFASSINGLDYSGDNFEAVYDNNTFILTLKEGKTAEAKAEVISSDYDGDVFLILKDDSVLLNKEGHDLKIDSDITIKMQGISGQPATINSRGNNLTIDGNILIEGSSVISSSGEDGANGTWRGPKDEEDRCRHDDDSGCNAQRPCSPDSDLSHGAQAAQPGSDAGTLSIKNIVVLDETSVSIIADGGKGGNGADGWSEHDGGRDQEAIGGGNGKKGGNAGLIKINNLTATNALIMLFSSGGQGGNGGMGGNDIGDDDHLGGLGANGGNSNSIEIINLNNSATKIKVVSLVGEGGKGGWTGDWTRCSGINGSAGQPLGNFSLTNLSGYAPFVINFANNVLIKGGYSEDIDFFADTVYTVGNKIDFTGCRLGGEGIELDEEGNQQISMTANAIDVNVWNPITFFDRVELTVLETPVFNRNIDCDLNPKYEMTIPFNGRIHNQNEGIVKDIKIINLKSGETEFSVPDKTFSNGVFSHEITAELYVNFFYRIEFTVCNNNNLCELFGFNFFTWKRLW